MAFTIKPSSVGKVAAMSKEELLELHHRKDSYIDFLHGIIENQNRQLYSTRKFRMENLNIIHNLHEMIDVLKMKLYTLTGSIKG